MEKLFSGLARKTGMIPGTLVHVGDLGLEPLRVRMLDFDADRYEEREIVDIEECRPYKERKSVTWITVEGVHDTALIEKLGQQFDLHPLMLEDVVNTEQRPKMENYGDYLYIVLRMLYERPSRDGEDGATEIDSEQVSLVLGSNFVITFLEDPGDVFDPVRRRIREKLGLVRTQGADYLAYALIDVLVDNYFGVLERFGYEVDHLEAVLLREPEPGHVEQIREMKRALIQIRRAVWPLRDVVHAMQRGESPLLGQFTMVFLRDLEDHVTRIADVVETLREMVGGMFELYMSNVSNRMNEVMKVLTVIATIFIPLTFLVGVYGMNFANMPELNWHYGYFYVWGVIIILGGGMLTYFRRKKWF